MPIRWLLAAILAILAPVAALGQQSFRTRLVDVTASNELQVRVDDWPLRVRLHGIEAVGDDSQGRRFLRSWIGADELRVDVRGTASKNIVYADVFTARSADSLNVELVRRGLARWSRRFAPGRADLAAAESAPHQRIATAPASPLSWISIALGAVALALLAAASRLCQPAARIRGAHRCVVREATGGWVRIDGVARATAGVVLSATGRVPALFLRERTWRYTPIGQPGAREYRWRLLSETREAVPFTLQDETGQIPVAALPDGFFPVRLSRFFNGVPIGKWHDLSYPDDIRTELDVLPADAPVTVVGRGVVVEGRPALVQALVIEGEVAAIGRERARGAVALTLAAAVLGGAAAAIAIAGRAG